VIGFAIWLVRKPFRYGPTSQDFRVGDIIDLTDKRWERDIKGVFAQAAKMCWIQPIEDKPPPTPTNHPPGGAPEPSEPESIFD